MQTPTPVMSSTATATARLNSCRRKSPSTLRNSSAASCPTGVMAVTYDSRCRFCTPAVTSSGLWKMTLRCEA